MIREFGAGFEFYTDTPTRVIEAALEHSYKEAVKEVPELAARAHLNERYDIVPGPRSEDGKTQVYGWHLRFESDSPPTNSVYEVTDHMRKFEESFKAQVKDMLSEYNRTARSS